MATNKLFYSLNVRAKPCFTLLVIRSRQKIFPSSIMKRWHIHYNWTTRASQKPGSNFFVRSKTIEINTVLSPFSLYLLCRKGHACCSSFFSETTLAIEQNYFIYVKELSTSLTRILSSNIIKEIPRWLSHMTRLPFFFNTTDNRSIFVFLHMEHHSFTPLWLGEFFEMLGSVVLDIYIGLSWNGTRVRYLAMRAMQLPFHSCNKQLTVNISLMACKARVWRDEQIIRS